MLHLVRRFFFSLRPGQPDPDDERWLVSILSRGEAELYAAQPVADRVHSVRCAASVRDELGEAASPAVIVASALHDVGKTESALGAPGRVAATVVGALLGRRRVEGASRRSDLLARFEAYLDHPERGARLLESAGSDHLAVAWARLHHERDADPLAGPELSALRRADRA